MARTEVSMNKTPLFPALALLLLPVAATANTPPAVDHQPAYCTVPEKPISLCAAISDDGNVAAARLYFRKAGEKHYAFVDMAFTGLDYCATLPAPREGKVEEIEYYVQAIDNDYEPTRTSTFRLPVEDEETCEFPAIEEDPERAAAIKVFGTSRKQGKKLDGAFVRTGVTFVPVKK